MPLIEWLIFLFLRDVVGPMSDTLSFFECRLSSGDPKRFWGHSNPTVADLGFPVGGGAKPPEGGANI